MRSTPFAYIIHPDAGHPTASGHLVRQSDPICNHSLGGDRPSKPPDHWNSVWLCDPKTKNTDHKTAQRFPDRENILGLSAAILLGSIADQIFWKTDQVILGRMFNTAVVAVYSVGAQIYMMYMQFGTQVSGVFYPKISALYQEENGLQKVSDLFIRIGRITFYIILLILSGFIIFGREFLLLWVGEGYEEAYWVAIIVMLPFPSILHRISGFAFCRSRGNMAFVQRFIS